MRPEFARDADAVRTIDAELLVQELRSKRPIHVLDIRTHRDFHAPPGHIGGAVCLPLSELRESMAVGCDHAHAIVVVSEHGVSARVAALELALAGFTEVCALEGGLARWMDLGLPLDLS